MGFDYFGAAIEVDRDKKKRITGFECFYVDRRGQRYRRGYMEIDYASNQGKFSDESYGAEIFEGGEVQSVVLSEDHGTTPGGSLAQWAQGQYLKHLAYLARVGCSEIFDVYLERHEDTWLEPASIEAHLMPELRRMTASLATYQQERGSAFAPDEIDAMCVYWSIGRLCAGPASDEMLQMFYMNVEDNLGDLGPHLPLLSVLVGDKLDAGYLDQFKE